MRVFGELVQAALMHEGLAKAFVGSFLRGQRSAFMRPVLDSLGEIVSHVRICVICRVRLCTNLSRGHEK